MIKRMRPSKHNHPAPAANATVSRPTPEQIAKRAEGIFLARGGARGCCDPKAWFQAERELEAKANVMTK